jgi:hypothetical protein
LSPTGLIAVIVDDLRRRRSPRGAPGGLEASHAEMRLHVVGASSEVVARERRVTHEAGSGRRRDFDAQASVAGAVIGTGREQLVAGNLANEDVRNRVKIRPTTLNARLCAEWVYEEC